MQAHIFYYCHMSECRAEDTKQENGSVYCSVIDGPLNGLDNMICFCLVLFCHGEKEELVRFPVIDELYALSVYSASFIIFSFCDKMR